MSSRANGRAAARWLLAIGYWHRGRVVREASSTVVAWMEGEFRAECRMVMRGLGRLMREWRYSLPTYAPEFVFRTLGRFSFAAFESTGAGAYWAVGASPSSSCDGGRV